MIAGTGFHRRFQGQTLGGPVNVLDAVVVALPAMVVLRAANSAARLQAVCRWPMRGRSIRKGGQA